MLRLLLSGLVKTVQKRKVTVIYSSFMVSQVIVRTQYGINCKSVYIIKIKPESSLDHNENHE